MSLIAVTGASGKLGGATLDFLLQRHPAPDRIVAVVRDPARSVELAARGVELRRGDYGEPRSLESAFAGVERLLFISTTVLGEERMLQHGNVVAAARGAGVRHIFYTSVVKPSADAIFAASPGHFRTEALIRNSGMAYTIFRNNLYMDLVPLMFGGAPATGTLVHNGGAGRIGFVARRDIAEALAAALTHGDHRHKTYDISAPVPYSLLEVAAALGRATGKRVNYQGVSSEEFRRALDGGGVPPPIVAMTVTLGDAIRAGEFDLASRDLEQLLGRAPQTLDAFTRAVLSPQ